MTKQEKERKQAMDKMREDVVELELRARYWKAQHDVRFYTLAAEKLQPEYDEWLSAQQKKNEELQKQYEEMLEKLASNPDVDIVPQEEEVENGSR